MLMLKISQKTISRAHLYLRTLEQLITEDEEFISSGKLANIIGLTDVQIRKDISSFGRVGKPNVGYSIEHLKKTLEEFILQNTVHVALFGVGNLGLAILKYQGFHNEKIKIVAAFEKDKKKIGKKIAGIKIDSVKNAFKIIKKSHADLGIIAVSEEFSQEAADIMSKAGLKGIVNFSPSIVKVSPGVLVKNIDLSIEFLSFFCSVKR